jgi:hypothetical protein
MELVTEQNKAQVFEALWKNFILEIANDQRDIDQKHIIRVLVSMCRLNTCEFANRMEKMERSTWSKIIMMTKSEQEDFDMMKELTSILGNVKIEEMK